MSRRAPNPVAEELSTYLLTGEADQGMSSSWTAFAGIALGGAGGAPDPERGVRDYRHGIGPARRSQVTRAREVRAALHALPDRAPGLPSWNDVLFCAYGPTPWAHICDKAWGAGKSATCMQLVGPHLGVALLTETVRTGFQGGGADQALLARQTGWNSPGEWLISHCRVARWFADTGARKLSRAQRKRRELAAAAAEALLAQVKAQAADLLRQAEAAYRNARFQTDDTQATATGRRDVRERARAGDRRRSL